MSVVREKFKKGEKKTCERKVRKKGKRVVGG
jgi:hypothetical protein